MYFHGWRKWQHRTFQRLQGPARNALGALYRVERLEERCLLSVTISEFGSDMIKAGSDPMGITLGPDGNLWFTEFGMDKIGRINPTTGEVNQFNLTAGSGPRSITSGPDGNLWFTESNGSGIGQMN